MRTLLSIIQKTFFVYVVLMISGSMAPKAQRPMANHLSQGRPYFVLRSGRASSAPHHIPGAAPHAPQTAEHPSEFENAPSASASAPAPASSPATEEAGHEPAALAGSQAADSFQLEEIPLAELELAVFRILRQRTQEERLYAITPQRVAAASAFVRRVLSLLGPIRRVSRSAPAVGLSSGSQR